MSESLKRKAARAGVWAVAKRLLKPIPVVGTAVSLGLAGYEMKKKGIVRGAAHVGLDLIPLVGTAKAIVELFTGDLIADKEKIAPALGIAATAEVGPASGAGS